MKERHHVVLIPGFFGFDTIGELRYFLGVKETLERRLAGRDIDIEVHEVGTLPTASIRHRAARVLEVIEEVSRADGGPVHLIGHSTGGLDARLAVAPTASLPTEFDTADAFARVRTLITVASPHHGTPLATYYGSAMGKPLLQLIALATVYIMRYGRLPLGAAIKLGGLFVKADDALGFKHTVVDQLYNELLADFTEDRREAVMDFLAHVSSDQSLVFQLTPAGIDLFNATTLDPSGIRYGSVVTRAAPPRLSSVLHHGADPYAQSMYVVYSGLWLIAARSRQEELADLDELQKIKLSEGYGGLPDSRDNDGVVPTLSQVWGSVIHTARGDHLDVVGHYGQTRQVEGVYADWIPTATGFSDADFEAVWGAVADFIAQGAKAPRPAKSREVAPAQSN